MGHNLRFSRFTKEFFKTVFYNKIPFLLSFFFDKIFFYKYLKKFPQKMHSL